MKLFLSSAGIRKETTDAFLKLLGRDPHGVKVAFIPTAANHPDEDKKYVQISKNELINLGFEIEEVDIEFFPKEELRAKLESADIIYINGGNTFYLLDQVRKSGLDKYIRELLETRVYFGTSAGSILACPDIGTSGWKGADRNDSKLTDLNSFGFVPFALFVHYEEGVHKKIVEEAKKNYPLELICLTNEQAVVVEDDKWEIVGSGEKVILK